MDTARLAITAQEHIKRAEYIGKSLDERLKTKKAAAPDFTLDEDFRQDFRDVTTVIQHCGNTMLKAIDANKEQLAGLTEDQLVAQFKAEMVSAVQSMTEEEWQSLVTARNKRV